MAENELQEELRRLRADLSNLQNDMAELVGTLRDLGVNKAEGMRSSVEDEIRNRREELRRRLNEARTGSRRAVEDAVEGIEQGIGQHPLSSLITAFGLGFIIAKLMDLGGRR